MHLPILRCLRASFFAGLIPVFLAPILCLGVLVLVEPQAFSPSCNVTPAALLLVAFFALWGGVITNFLLGFPSLLLLELLRANYVPIAGIVGASLGFLFPILLGASMSQAQLRESWPIFIFFALLGGVCGMTASYISQQN